MTNRNVVEAGRLAEVSGPRITKLFSDSTTGRQRTCAAKVHTLIRGDLEAYRRVKLALKGRETEVTRTVQTEVSRGRSTTNNQIANRLTKRTSVKKHRKRRFFLEIARHLTSSGGWLNETAKSIEPKPAFLNRELEHRLRSYVTSRCQILICFPRFRVLGTVCRLLEFQASFYRERPIVQKCYY